MGFRAVAKVKDNHDYRKQLIWRVSSQLVPDTLGANVLLPATLGRHVCPESCTTKVLYSVRFRGALQQIRLQTEV
jgi:hypothetical protein